MAQDPRSSNISILGYDVACDIVFGSRGNTLSADTEPFDNWDCLIAKRDNIVILD
jgi:hypothetical protein